MTSTVSAGTRAAVVTLTTPQNAIAERSAGRLTMNSIPSRMSARMWLGGRSVGAMSGRRTRTSPSAESRKLTASMPRVGPGPIAVDRIPAMPGPMM